MRYYTCSRAYPHCLLLAALFLSLPVQAGITFRIYTGGAQAGEVHIDSPEGHYIYFRENFNKDAPPGGLCGIRWSAAKEELAWYWGNPARMDYLPGNGKATEELSYMARHSSCRAELPNERFHTPCTPNGAPPPGAEVLVVEVPYWKNVTFTNYSLQPLPPPAPEEPEGGFGICQRYPPFCEYSPALERPFDDPCRQEVYGDLICRTLPGAQSALVRTIDLASALGASYAQIQGHMIYFYSPGEVRKLKKSIQDSQERLALAQLQFRQLQEGYHSLEGPLQRLNSIPFSHYAYTTVLTHLELTQVWMERSQVMLNAIDAAARGKSARLPKAEAELLEQYRQWALFHLNEAKFWMERQHAWIVPMER